LVPFRSAMLQSVPRQPENAPGPPACRPNCICMGAGTPHARPQPCAKRKHILPSMPFWGVASGASFGGPASQLQVHSRTECGGVADSASDTAACQTGAGCPWKAPSCRRNAGSEGGSGAAAHTFSRFFAVYTVRPHAVYGIYGHPHPSVYHKCHKVGHCTETQTLGASFSALEACTDLIPASRACIMYHLVCV
jgi:hypothetical protein